jgi:8-oxo-dGTP pyrophosphatase MutT (NUDIX family)
MAGADAKSNSPAQALRAVDPASPLRDHKRTISATIAGRDILATMTSWRIRFEPVLTPVFRTWWRLQRSMTLGVRTLICDDAGRVLLVRHSYAPGWHLPGGGVEKGETAHDAALREAAEEGGIAAERAELIGFFSNHALFPGDHIALYRIDEWRPCPPRGGVEILERGFFARDALPEGTTPGTRRRLAEIFDGAPQDGRW